MKILKAMSEGNDILIHNSCVMNNVHEMASMLNRCVVSRENETNLLTRKAIILSLAIMKLPAFIFHESCHIMTSYVLSVKFIIDDVTFLKRIDEFSDKYVISMKIHYPDASDRPHSVMAIMIAPNVLYFLMTFVVIGMTLASIVSCSYLFCTTNCFVLVYVMICRKIFWTSDEDEKSFKMMKTLLNHRCHE